MICLLLGACLVVTSFGWKTYSTPGATVWARWSSPRRSRLRRNAALTNRCIRSIDAGSGRDDNLDIGGEEDRERPGGGGNSYSGWIGNEYRLKICSRNSGQQEELCLVGAGVRNMRFSAASISSSLEDGDNSRMMYPISITRSSRSRSTRDQPRSSMMFATAVGPGIEPHRSAPPKMVPRTQPNGAAEGDAKEVDKSRFVLIVDDDPNLLEVTSFVLESEGMAVETAKNGEEALALLRAGRLPALVLLDLMMPVMSGWEFLDEVAKDPLLQVVPVVVLTAAERAQVPGTVEVLRKPMDLRALLRVVERHVRGDDDAGA